jgi:hypothetical protein
MTELFATLPQEFSLRGFPGHRFRVNQEASYYSLSQGAQMVVDIMTERGWVNFSRAGYEELRSQVIAK